MIPHSFIEEIQARTDIGEIIASYIPLKKTGRNFKALCPFHSEKTPSFFVNPQKQIFHCFGCGEGGGAIQFLMLYEKVSFVESVEILGKRLGMDIPYQKEGQVQFKTSLYEVLKEAAVFFYTTLTEDKSAESARSYLHKRGIDKETIEKFSLGYAAENKSLLDYMRKKGFAIDILEKASLVVPKNNSFPQASSTGPSDSIGFRDLFRGRIMFPIWDVRGRVVGFGARTLADRENIPKYINSLENVVYSKRANLFGFNFSKDDIIKNDFAFVVEGYFDMIVPFMGGVKNIAASLGTALTIEQIQLLKRYTNNIVLVFDSDKAGEQATLRSFDLLLENDVKIKVLRLPAGFDPDTILRQKGRDYFLELLRNSVDFFDYKLQILQKTNQIGSIEGKTKIAQELLALIEKLKSEVEKYEYIKKLAGKLSIKEEILIAELRKNNYRSNRTIKKTNNGDAFVLKENEYIPMAEKIILKYMLTNKKAYIFVRKNLNENDFSFLLARKVAAYLFKNYSETEDISLTKILGSISDKEISSFIAKILIDDNLILDTENFKSSIIKVKEKRAKNSRTILKDQIKEAEIKGDMDRVKILVNEYKNVGKMNSDAAS